jgi:adenine-specific DNA-methyltransferase
MKSLNYIGSKRSLIEFLNDSIDSVIDNKKDYTFCDLFAGTGIVGFTIGKHFKSIVSNDMEYYSFVINKGLYVPFTFFLKKKIEFLNQTADIETNIGDGFVIENYSEPRLFFTKDNARRIDVMRTELNNMLSKKEITKSDFYFLLGSLIVSSDKVSNTASVYGAFLKQFKPSAQKKLILEPLHDSTEDINHIVLNCDINTIDEQKELEGETLDVVYLDPPYNNRQYGANYCPLNYIARYDNKLLVKGKTGLIDNYNKSNYCRKKGLRELFENLIEKLVKKSAKYIFISYNDEGLLSIEELRELLSKYGKVELKETKYKRFKSSIEDDSKNSVQELLWCLIIH